MAEIETIYRALIDYEPTGDSNWLDDDPVEKVEDFAFRTCRAGVVECETFSGNVRFAPYIVLESLNRAALEDAVSKIERYIRKFSRQLTLIGQFSH